jgi:hypothetical protein
VAYDKRLLGAVARLFADTVMGWYGRRLAEGERGRRREDGDVG